MVVYVVEISLVIRLPTSNPTYMQHNFSQCDLHFDLDQIFIDTYRFPSINIMDASRDSVDEEISISMFTQRTMLTCDYDHPICVQKAMNHLEDHKPIPTFALSAGRQNIDTYNLLSITLRLAPTSTDQTYIAAFIMYCQCAEDFV